MMKRIAGWSLGLLFAGQACAHSLTVSTLFDGDDGRSVSLHGRFSPIGALNIGASAGHSRSRFQQGEEEKFSGTTLGASADVHLGGFLAGVSANRWRDSGDLRSTMLHGEAGWLSDSGLALAALATNRSVRVTYTTTTLLGQTRERNVDFEGTGFGGDVSYFGETWTAGARFLDYDYGRNVQRVRNVLEGDDILRFPRLQQLLTSVATRAAGAPDRELSVMLGRQFGKFSLTADAQWQRDALTADETRGAGLTLGFLPLRYLGVDVSAGASKTDEADTIGWVGLALTLRSVR